MLARFRVLLPYTFSIPYNDYNTLKPLVFKHGEYTVTAHPPVQGNVDSSVSDITSAIPLMDAISNLNEASILMPTSAVKINGHDIIKANLLQFDLLARRDFRREWGTSAKRRPEFDPPDELFFHLANNIIGRLRAIGRLSSIRFVSPDNAAGWKVEYLADDGQPLQKDETLFRARFVPKMTWQISGITAGVWEQAFGQPPDFTPPIWDMLLLDAQAQLPDVNTSVVLASAALETFINISLDILAEGSSVAPETWDWLTTRGDDWRKQPSTYENYDQVLFLLTGRSLKKEKADLWAAFTKLRDARNSIVHQGRAVVRTGSKKEKEVSPDMAMKFVTDAGLIISWVEAILPEERRRKYFKGNILYSFDRPATGPNNSNTALMAVKGKLDGMRLVIGDQELLFK
jgi:hypothetical protein